MPSAGAPGRAGTGHQLPTIGPQCVDDRDVVGPEGAGRLVDGRLGQATVGAVPDQEHALDAVLARRLEQGLDHLGQVAAPRRQVDPGVEGAVATEGEHHQGVLRLEAEQDRDHGEHVVRAAGHERGGGSGGDGFRCHASNLPAPADSEQPSVRPLWTSPSYGVLWTPGGLRRARPEGVVCGCASRRVGAPSRPGRVLRRRRAARQAVPARQAGRRRRGRWPRGGVDGLLRGPRVRRPFGDVDAARRAPAVRTRRSCRAASTPTATPAPG